MSKVYRSLRETPEFIEHCAAIGEMQHIDAALDALTWALTNDAEQYPIIPGTQRLRMARSKAYQRGGIYIPVLKVWFVILDEHTVELRIVTHDEPEDEEF